MPKEKPSLPVREYGSLEVQDEEKREKTRDALNLLWDALELSGANCDLVIARPTVIVNPAIQAHLKTYDFFAEMLLGEDRPDHEMWIL